MRPLLEPTSFHLSMPQNDAGILRVFNNEDFPVHWGAKPYLWEQGIDGKDDLASTLEVSVAPASMRLEPHTGAEFRIRYSGDEVSDVEKTFRIVLTSAAINEGNIEVTYTHSLPIFIEPANSVASVDTSLAMSADGGLSLELYNQGNKHSFVKDMHVLGLETGGGRVFTVDRAGWYLLAGKKVTYRADVSPADCEKSVQFTALVKFRDGAAKEVALKGPFKCTNDSKIRTGFQQAGDSVVKPVSASAPN